MRRTTPFPPFATASPYARTWLHRAAPTLAFLLLAACAVEADRVAGPKNARPALSAAAAADRPYVYTQLDFPGARQTFPSGINAAGNIVGWYQDNTAARKIHGFVYANGEFTSVDYPGASVTHLRGIGPNGAIAGNYKMPGERGFDWHGFVMTPEGEFIEASYPGHYSTIAQRILPDGTIVGCYHDNDAFASMRGALFGAAAPVDVTLFASMHNGATPDGKQIVGRYYDETLERWRAYWIADGTVETFDVGENSAYTEAWDISPGGIIVGVFGFETHGHGFAYDPKHEVTSILTYPGATWTEPYGINAGGTIVGRYFVGGFGHGFVARRGPAN